MNRNDVIKCLEQVYKWSLDWDDRDDGLDYCDAIQEAIDAIRKNQKAMKLDRRMFIGCDLCRTSRGSLRNYGYKFCHSCGKPLTDEAWAELERRLNGGTVDNS